MALTKIDPKKIFKTCSILDPAIDKKLTGDEGLKNFEENYDIKHLKFKEGVEPTIFHILNILSTDEARIKQDHQKIEFPELDNANDETIKSIDIKELKPKLTQVNTQEMLIKYFECGISVYQEGKETFSSNANIFPYTVVQELGALIMMRTQVGDDLKNVLGS